MQLVDQWWVPKMGRYMTSHKRGLLYNGDFIYQPTEFIAAPCYSRSFIAWLERAREYGVPVFDKVHLHHPLDFVGAVEHMAACSPTLTGLSATLQEPHALTTGLGLLPRLQHLEQLRLSVKTRRLPAALKRLPRLTSLVFHSQWSIQSGWQNLPRQLQHLELHTCGQNVPWPTLAAMPQLTKLVLRNFQPKSVQLAGLTALQDLELLTLHMEQLPGDLESVTQLTSLSLTNNMYIDDWRQLRQLRQLRRLDLGGCSRTPAELADMEHLTWLDLSSRFGIRWQHLPRGLRYLSIRRCLEERLPEQLAALTRLETLDVHATPLAGTPNWQHLPRSLRSLDLSKCQVHQVPDELAALSQLTRLDLSENNLGGAEASLQHLPLSLRHLGLCQCGMTRPQAEAELRRLTGLTTLLFVEPLVTSGSRFTQH